jgi:glutathione S-transferase
LLPSAEDQRLEARLWDRFFDLYVQVPLGKVVTDRLRADGEHDSRGVAEAMSTLAIAEARPYFHLFPYKDSIPARFLRDEPLAH